MAFGGLNEIRVRRSMFDDSKPSQNYVLGSKDEDSLIFPGRIFRTTCGCMLPVDLNVLYPAWVFQRMLSMTFDALRDPTKCTCRDCQPLWRIADKVQSDLRPDVDIVLSISPSHVDRRVRSQGGLRRVECQFST